MNRIILVTLVVIGVSGCLKGHSTGEFVDSQIPAKGDDMSVVQLKLSEKYRCRR